MKRKIFSFLLCLCLAVSCLFSTACNGGAGDKQASVKALMELSVNPAIELVIDTNDKVVSANATNDEGNFILAKAQFVGKTQDQAVELFIKTTHEYGFIDSSTEADFNIAVSGEDARVVFDKAQVKAQAYLNEKGLSLISVEFNSINKKALETKANFFNAHLPTSVIQSYSETKLLELINASIKEVTDLGLKTQEIKDLYFYNKAYDILLAKFRACLDSIKNESDANIAIFEQGITEFSNAVSLFSRDFADTFLDTSGRYQQAVSSLVTVKSAVLNARKTNAEISSALKESLALAETVLETTKASVSVFVNSYKATANSTASILDEMFNQFSILSSFNQANIDSAIAKQQKNFCQSFKATFGSDNVDEINYIKVTPWDNLG